MLWRELVDTGGKGLYLGGLKEFEDYALKYYAISPSTDLVLEGKIASENRQTFLQQQQERENFVPTPPIKICLTDATSTVAYHLAQLLATGAVTRPDTMVALHLFNPELNTVCEGVIMELQDLASPCLEYIKFSSSMEEAFAGVSMAYILDYPYTTHNLNLFNLDVRNTRLTAVVNQFREYTKALENAASKDVKVVVSGCFANSGAGIMAASASTLPSSSFVASPCLAESQMKAVIASRLHLNGSDIMQAAVWGKTHGPAIIADTSFTRVQHYPGAVMGPDPFNLPLTRCEFDKDWLEKTFPQLMEARHGALEGYREEGAAVSEAVGLATFGRDWWLGETQQWRSVGVVNDGTAYSIPKGVACSTPCHCKEGKWECVPDLALSELIQVLLDHKQCHNANMHDTTSHSLFNRNN